MPISNLDQLAHLLHSERDSLMGRWRQQVALLPSARKLDVPTLNDHIPELLDELIAEFRSSSNETIPETLGEGSAPSHGLQRVQDAFEIEEVVAEYNILRGCIHDLADERGLTLQGKPFRIFNRVFDHAIGQALQSYSAQRALEVEQRREEYLAFVAHDLRTPLNAIALSGAVLERLSAASGQNDAPEMWVALRRNVKHLDDLVNQILEEKASLETEVGLKVELREFDLWPLAERLIHDLRPVAGTGSTQLLNRIPGDLVVYSDAHLLRRVFQNLIANAIRYTPRGIIEVGAQDCPSEHAVECWVRDDGEGIAPSMIERVFEKGEADPANIKATGLGLAIVKTFVEATGGKVRLESIPGKGSTFCMSLPKKGSAGTRQ